MARATAGFITSRTGCKGGTTYNKRMFTKSRIQLGQLWLVHKSSPHVRRNKHACTEHDTMHCTHRSCWLETISHLVISFKLLNFIFPSSHSSIKSIFGAVLHQYAETAVSGNVELSNAPKCTVVPTDHPLQGVLTAKTKCGMVLRNCCNMWP